MACKCSNFCSAHSPSPSFCLSAELFHPQGPGVLEKLSVWVPALFLSKIPSPQDWAQSLAPPGSPTPSRSQELMAAIFLTLREWLLKDVMRSVEVCGNQRPSLGLRCSSFPLTLSSCSTPVHGVSLTRSAVPSHLQVASYSFFFLLLQHAQLGIEPAPPAVEVLTTGLPGKPHLIFLNLPHRDRSSLHRGPNQLGSIVLFSSKKQAWHVVW